ncbi:MAG: SDR family NAD(P)-dependent oxidoreductase, partial [Betaproteobacteria bacterium]
MSLPRRFRRPTLLIVGCGDVGLRVLPLVRGRWRVVVLTSTPARVPALRAAGAVPLQGNLDEPALPWPQTDRAWRRVDAEARVRHRGRAGGVRCAVLRIPGIYATDREGGDPRERVRRGTLALRAEDDVYTNHIHADDLARACVAAL